MKINKDLLITIVFIITFGITTMALIGVPIWAVFYATPQVIAVIGVILLIALLVLGNVLSIGAVLYMLYDIFNTRSWQNLWFVAIMTILSMVLTGMTLTLFV